MENGENETTIKNLTKDQLLKAYKVSISCAFLWPPEEWSITKMHC
jgi:hypothetical protein